MSQAQVIIKNSSHPSVKITPRPQFGFFDEDDIDEPSKASCKLMVTTRQWQWWDSDLCRESGSNVFGNVTIIMIAIQPGGSKGSKH